MKHTSLARLFGPYLYIIRMLVIGLLTLSLSRIALVIWQADRVLPTQELAQILLQGVRADIILMSMGAALPVLLLLVWANKWAATSWFKFSYWWCLGWLIAVLFLEMSTPSFIMQYDIRPNRLYIEYLKYPKEVLSTLWHGFRIPLLFGLALTAVIAYGYSKFLKAPADQHRVFSVKTHLMVWPIAVVLIFAGIRSTTQHRPANPAMFAITADSLVNSLVINSGYSVLFAMYNMKHEAKSSEIYGKLDADTMLQQTRSWPWVQERNFSSPEQPTLHQQIAAVQREKPLNIVIVLQESLGATFVESLGGLPVTPELEKLKAQGWWFENLYASGTRSVRGIEAVIAGFAPTPAQSTVKLSNSQRNFTTIASELKEQGYNTSFMYGGEAHFDNMSSFFTGNGITTIYDLDEIEASDNNGVFVASWGASDEDLFEAADRELSRLHATGQPFFTLIFTSSNHEPFDFPAGRIELYEEPANTVNNAVKYADWATGQFFKTAQTRDYWQDTLFLVVADHDNRVYGNNLIPLEKFKIPGLILGADIQPERITTLASQIDLAPTLLSLAGVSGCHTMIGRDLAKDRTSPGRALIQFNDKFALMEEEQLTILMPNEKSALGHYDRQKKVLTLSSEAASPAAYQKALAHVQLPSYLYREMRNDGSQSCL